MQNRRVQHQNEEVGNLRAGASAPLFFIFLFSWPLYGSHFMATWGGHFLRRAGYFSPLRSHPPNPECRNEPQGQRAECQPGTLCGNSAFGGSRVAPGQPSADPMANKADRLRRATDGWVSAAARLPNQCSVQLRALPDLHGLATAAVKHAVLIVAHATVRCAFGGSRVRGRMLVSSVARWRQTACVQLHARLMQGCLRQITDGCPDADICQFG